MAHTMELNKLTIDGNIITQNISMIRKRANNLPLTIVVKANGYGTDYIQLAQLFERLNINFLGVAFVTEAISLREEGIRLPIMVLYTHPSEADKILSYQLTPCIASEELLTNLEKAAFSRKVALPVHINLDTGMHRLGCDFTKAVALAQRIDQSKNLFLEGVMTHLSSSNIPSEKEFTWQQLTSFDVYIQKLKADHIHYKYAHIANSSVFLNNYPTYDMLRLGILPFGIYPAFVDPIENFVKPAISLETTIIALHTIKKGESVGYQRSYRAQREREVIAVLPLGYYDGIHANFSASGKVSINCHLAPIVGVICMDFIMVDVTHIENVHVGDTCQIFGPDLPIEHAAKFGHTTPHQFLSSISSRIRRVFIPSHELITT